MESIEIEVKPWEESKQFKILEDLAFQLNIILLLWEKYWLDFADRINVKDNEFSIYLRDQNKTKIQAVCQEFYEKTWIRI